MWFIESKSRSRRNYRWLTGYSTEELEHQIAAGVSYKKFFAEVPLTGQISG